jgi:hypothetical protein
MTRHATYLVRLPLGNRSLSRLADLARLARLAVRHLRSDLRNVSESLAQLEANTPCPLTVRASCSFSPLSCQPIVLGKFSQSNRGSRAVFCLNNLVLSLSASATPNTRLLRSLDLDLPPVGPVGGAGGLECAPRSIGRLCTSRARKGKLVALNSARMNEFTNV